mgnify:CR=1 FL=1
MIPRESSPPQEPSIPKAALPVQKLVEIEVRDIDIQMPSGVLHFTLRPEDTFDRYQDKIELIVNGEQVTVERPHVYWSALRRRKMMVPDSLFTPKA